MARRSEEKVGNSSLILFATKSDLVLSTRTYWLQHAIHLSPSITLKWWEQSIIFTITQKEN